MPLSNLYHCRICIYMYIYIDLQTRYILGKISRALGEVGSSMSDIVHVTVYTTEITDMVFIASEFSRAFVDIMPTVTMLAVSDLPRDDCSVMIQVHAIIQHKAST